MRSRYQPDRAAPVAPPMAAEPPGFEHDEPQRTLCPHEGIDARVIPYFRLPGAWFNEFAGAIATRAIAAEVKKLHNAQPFDVIYGTNIFLGGDVALRLGKQLEYRRVVLRLVPMLTPCPRNHRD